MCNRFIKAQDKRDVVEGVSPKHFLRVISYTYSMSTRGLTLHRLRIFRAVCELGSLNQASHALYLTQSAVSQHLKGMESALGVKLLQRGPQGTVPTPAGQQLYDYSLRILELVAEAESQLLQPQFSQGQQLKLEGTAGISVYLLPQWLRRFQTTFPNVELTIQTGGVGDVIEAVARRSVDFGFVAGPLDAYETSQTRFLEISHFQYDLLVNPQHPWVERVEIKVSELANMPFINRLPRSQSRRWMESALAERGVELRTVAELATPGAVKYALLNQLGIALLPHYTVERELERGELIAIPLASGPLRRPLIMLWSDSSPFTPLQRAFLLQLVPDLPAVEAIL